MQQHHRNPLAGSPRTTEHRGKDGKPRFSVRPRVLTPVRAKLADALSAILGFVLLLGCIFAFFSVANPGWREAAMLTGLFFAGGIVLRQSARFALRSTTEIEMSVDTIRVRRWLIWRSYNRLYEHRFALAVHDRAEQEQRDLDYKSRQASVKGQVLKQTPYYMASFHVVLVYAGQRIDLLSVYGQKEAAAIVARLQYCDRSLNEAIAMSGGISKRPEDDWNEAPGGLHRG